MLINLHGKGLNIQFWLVTKTEEATCRLADNIKLVFEKESVRIWTALIWPRIRSSNGHFVSVVINLQVYKLWEIFWQMESPVASQEGLLHGIS